LPGSQRLAAGFILHDEIECGAGTDIYGQIRTFADKYRQTRTRLFAAM